MSWWRVIERRRNTLLHIHHVIMAEAVNFASSNASLYKGGDVVQNFAGQAACDAHFFYFLRSLDTDGHNCLDFKKKRWQA